MAEAYHQALLNRLNTIGDMGSAATSAAESLGIQKAQALAAKRISDVANSAGPLGETPTYDTGTSYSPLTGAGAQGAIAGSGNYSAIIKGIFGQESSRNYKAYNESSRASGRYQMLPYNITQWSRELFGKPVSYDTFMNSPKIQDQVANYKLNQYMKRFGGPAGAAVAWYAGEGTAESWVRNKWGSKYNKKQGGGKYPSINQYARDILRRMGLL